MDHNTSTYVVATIRPWNLTVFNQRICKYPGTWHLIDSPGKLTSEYLRSLRPDYIFFPHWSLKIPQQLLEEFSCVCFHETDLPYGRGGSPLQNLIVRGHRSTVISALQMISEFDAGPIYLKKELSLEGLAEEIFIRAANLIADMILHIISQNPPPQPQHGKVELFRRRTPEMSLVPEDANSLQAVFDHIRMLDCTEYPKAFFETKNLRFEFTRPALRTNAIEADVKITIKAKTDD